MGPESCRHRKHRKIRPPQYEKRFSHSSHPSRGLGSPGSETHEGSLQLHTSEPVHSNIEKYCLHKIRCVFPLLHTPLWGTISGCSLPLSSQHSNMGSRLPGFK